MRNSQACATLCNARPRTRNEVLGQRFESARRLSPPGLYKPPRVSLAVCCISGGRHRRDAAERQTSLGGQDGGRVRGLRPPERRRRPLINRLVERSRLDDEILGVYELG